MKIRVNSEDGVQLSTICRQLKLESADGKKYETDCANTEGTFRIIQSIPSPKAEPFKRWLAKVGYERIQEIEDPELATKRTRALYKAKGYSDAWIGKRMRGIAIREELTDQWQNRGIKEPKECEILLSKDATPGIAYYLKDIAGKMIPSSGILRLTVKNADQVLSEYLTSVLNSVIVQKQIERNVGGSIINHWLVDQVKNTLIPVLSLSTQKQISEKISQSFSYREQSKYLLDIAKRGVEMAIEKSEKEAMGWIEIETAKIREKHG